MAQQPVKASDFKPKPLDVTLEEIDLTASTKPDVEESLTKDDTAEEVNTTESAPDTDVQTDNDTETTSDESTKPAETTVSTTQEPLSIHDKNPSAWAIKPLEGDQIEAYNSMTKKHFQGTVLEFNEKYLRGK